MKIFYSLLVLSAFVSTQVYAEECQSTEDKCKCVFADGTGYDLREISNANYFEAQTNQSLSFYFHACGDTKILPNFGDNVTNSCAEEGYSLCMLRVSTVNGTTEKNASAIGKLENLDFKGNRLMFHHEQQLKIATIILECTPESNETVLYAPLKIDTDQIFLTLYTRFACKTEIIKPRGFFMTLLIILFTLLFSYLFLGILINYFLVGARGYELIPNYDFWCKTWRSLKLLFIYLKNGCRVIPAEDSYDAI